MILSPGSIPTGTDGRDLLYRRQPTNPGIWAVPFSLDSLEITGEPFLVLPNGVQPVLSKDGTLVSFVGDEGGLEQLVRVDRDGEVVGTSRRRSPRGVYRHPVHAICRIQTAKTLLDRKSGA